jgi:hypothetical protein
MACDRRNRVPQCKGWQQRQQATVLGAFKWVALKAF